jgi:hypothetical protein
LWLAYWFSTNSAKQASTCTSTKLELTGIEHLFVDMHLRLNQKMQFCALNIDPMPKKNIHIIQSVPDFE